MNLRMDQGVEMADRAILLAQFDAARKHSERLSETLSAEDHGIQSMPDTSPAKWHLAHTTWFFEALVLCPYMPGYAPFDPRFFELFNSYYEALGPRHPRAQRGLLSRPSLDVVRTYRRHVESHLRTFLAIATDIEFAAIQATVILGIHHEQQHQELLLTDIKHGFSCNALLPAVNPNPLTSNAKTRPAVWVAFPGGPKQVGHSGEGFAFDNEGPRHTAWLTPFALASRPVTCGEYRTFMQDGGYHRPEFWLSDGWACRQSEQWEAPLYWRAAATGEWEEFTLHGLHTIDREAPVCHVSYYEAAAYAAWAEARLPSEFEWEHAAAQADPVHRFEWTHLHPRLVEKADAGLQALFGEVWEWTQSAYLPYPGFQPWAGPAAEYNGKFMINQMVLRGGSCVTPPDHLRRTYRNFFPPAARWQFSGIRLAKDCS